MPGGWFPWKCPPICGLFFATINQGCLSKLHTIRKHEASNGKFKRPSMKNCSGQQSSRRKFNSQKGSGLCNFTSCVPDARCPSCVPGGLGAPCAPGATPVSQVSAVHCAPGAENSFLACKVHGAGCPSCIQCLLLLPVPGRPQCPVPHDSETTFLTCPPGARRVPHPANVLVPGVLGIPVSSVPRDYETSVLACLVPACPRCLGCLGPGCRWCPSSVPPVPVRRPSLLAPFPLTLKKSDILAPVAQEAPWRNLKQRVETRETQGNAKQREETKKMFFFTFVFACAI